MTFRFLATLLSALLILLITGCREQPSPSDSNTNKIVLSATKPGTRLDPHIDIQWEVLYVLSAVYDTLVRQASNGEFVAGLAKSWTLSEDAKTYTLYLRQDVTFHDGTPFNAEAVKFNIERIKNLGPRSLKAGSLLTGVINSNIIDEFTIKIELKRPDGSFLFNISLPYIAMASPTALSHWGDSYHFHQSGTGPFKFAEYEPGDHYTLVRNEAYNWPPFNATHDGPAYLEEIEWRFLPEPSTRSPALESGDVDIAFDLVPTNLVRIAQTPSLDVTFARLTGQSAYWHINTQLMPTNELAVRRAILYAADMSAGTQAITRGISPVAHGPLSAVTPEYALDLERMYPYNPEKAKQLLDNAGWIDSDGGGIRKKDGNPLVIKLSMVSWGQSQNFSVLLQAQLRRVGIQLHLEMLDYAVQLEAGQQGRKNMLFMGGSGYSAADTLRPFFHSDNAKAGFAFSKFYDPILDKLLDDAPTIIDLEQRKSMYQQAQVRIMEQAQILPIYDFTLLIGYRNNIQGLEWRSVGLVPTFYEMSLIKQDKL